MAETIWKSASITIKSIDSENKVRTGYEMRFKRDLAEKCLINVEVQKSC